MKKILSIILLMFIILTLVLPVNAENEINNMKAKVVEINGIEEIKQEDEKVKKVQNVTVRILEGEYENEEYEMAYVITEDIEDITSNIELKEDDDILVTIEEKEGEITNISYLETINQNYMLYIVGAILLILLIIIGINTGMMQIIIYLLTMIFVCFALIFSMKMGWNLILVSSILSVGITLSYIIRVNGINRKTFIIILETIFSIAIAGILMNILFDLMGLANANVKITDNLVNIKDLISSCIIVVSCGLCNSIILVKLNIDAYINRPYKTKSDNIIEGQRSLKL